MDTRYPDGHEVTVRHAGDRYAFLTRDGLVSKTAVRPAELALVGTLGDATGHAVVLGADFGAVPTLLARGTDCRATAVTTSARAADCCRVNAERNDAAVRVGLDAWVPVETADHLLYAPAEAVPDVVARERLARGLAVTDPGGTVAVAAPTPADLDPYRSLFERCCRSVTTETGDAAVLSGERAEADPETGLEPESFRASVGAYTCRFLTLPGLFSWRGLDDGTAALLSAASVADGDRVLDLACGYGAVGAFVGARTDCRLSATDDDALATRLARRNYERNGVTPDRVVTADGLDGFDDGRRFDTVLANPPTHAGSGVTRKLFAGVADRLAPDGAFWLVYNEVMGYDYTLRSNHDLAVEVVATPGSFEVAVARPR